MKHLTVLIPCYNEEKVILHTIDTVFKTLSELNIKFEIVTINDGSTDNSLNEINKILDKTRLINLDRNHGYGYALKQGLKVTEGDWVAIIDADLTYDPKYIPKLIEYTKTHDMVVGARTGKNVNIPLIRRPAKYFITKLASWLVEYPIPDLNSGLRLFRKKDAMRFFSYYPNGFSFTTTITMSYLSNDLSVKYIPIDYHKRFGKSKIRPIKDTYNFIVLLVKLTVYYNPLKIFLPISLTLFLFFIASLIYDIVFIDNIGDKTILFITISLLTFLQGLTADLIIKRTKI